MTENKHFLQPGEVGSEEKHCMSIHHPIAIGTVILHQSMTQTALPATMQEIMPARQPHFFFAHQHRSSHLLYG
jgi:hypothetical protein